jgi:hypothetical protein
MYNFQKLSETTSLRCNNSFENSVPKRYGYVFLNVATESYPVRCKHVASDSKNITVLEQVFNGVLKATDGDDDRLQKR